MSDTRAQLFHSATASLIHEELSDIISAHWNVAPSQIRSGRGHSGARGRAAEEQEMRILNLFSESYHLVQLTNTNRLFRLTMVNRTKFPYEVSYI